MKTRIKQLLVPLLVVVGLFGVLVPITPVGAVNVYQPCQTVSGTSSNAVCSSTTDDAGSLLKTIVNTLLFIIGAVAVIMIIVGGIRYVVSAGNAQAAASAKNTILYAVIGLVIAFLAYAIVNWVLAVLQHKSPSAS